MNEYQGVRTATSDEVERLPLPDGVEVAASDRRSRPRPGRTCGPHSSTGDSSPRSEFVDAGGKLIVVGTFEASGRTGGEVAAADVKALDLVHRPLTRTPNARGLRTVTSLAGARCDTP